MEKYLGVEVIYAEAMTRLEYNKLRGWDLPKDENGDDAGYLVEYVNGGQANHADYEGYISWSPKKVFAEAYKPVDKLTFGDAVEAMKRGFKVVRQGWNGKGIFLYYVPAQSYPATTDIAKLHFGETVPYEPYIAMKHVGNKVVPWLASQTDILADDWQIILD